MSRRQSWPQFFAGWLQLVVVDVRRSFRRLVVWRHDRRHHRLIISLTRPSFKPSRWYWHRRWRSQQQAWLAVRHTMGLVLISLSLFGLVMLSEPFRNQPVFYASSSSQVLSATTSSQPATALRRSLPVLLIVPSLKIKTSLVQLGRLADGTMATPTNPSVAGWYRYSPTPGQIGPAVIVGHVDSRTGPAVFYDLRKLKIGQVVSVRRRDGSQVNFSVYKLANYSQRNFPTKVVYGDTVRPELRLITCGGPFNYLTGHYTQNTVVFAVIKAAGH